MPCGLNAGRVETGVRSSGSPEPGDGAAHGAMDGTGARGGRAATSARGSGDPGLADGPAEGTGARGGAKLGPILDLYDLDPAYFPDELSPERRAQRRAALDAMEDVRRSLAHGMTVGEIVAMIREMREEG